MHATSTVRFRCSGAGRNACHCIDRLARRGCSASGKLIARGHRRVAFRPDSPARRRTRVAGLRGRHLPGRVAVDVCARRAQPQHGRSHDHGYGLAARVHYQGADDDAVAEVRGSRPSRPRRAHYPLPSGLSPWREGGRETNPGEAASQSLQRHRCGLADARR